MKKYFERKSRGAPDKSSSPSAPGSMLKTGQKYDCLLFELDDTLYPLSTGITEACGQNIKKFMVEELGILRSGVDDLSNLLSNNYGTTMAGLWANGFDFDHDKYHHHVLGRLPYKNLKPDPVLRDHLITLPIRKLIFTNTDKFHAVKVLKKLGLEECFDGIICFQTLNPTSSKGFPIFDTNGDGHFAKPNPNGVCPEAPILCKPSENAFELALKLAKLDPQRTLFFDNNVRNIQAAKSVGLHTVLIGTYERIEEADYALESIHDLRAAIPELWYG